MIAAAKRSPGRPRKAELATVTILADFRDALRAAKAKASQISWPSPRYRDDPVGFARDVLGIEPWSKQRDILTAMATNRKVAVASCTKAGKTTTACIIALWWYTSWPNSRTLLTAVNEKQVEQVLYRELRRLILGAGRCVSCRKSYEELIEAGYSEAEATGKCPRPCPHSALIDGTVSADAVDGLQAADLREVIAVQSRTAEGYAGLSSPHVLVIIDEASAVPDATHQAIEGNLAAAGRQFMISNPSRRAGKFFRVFHAEDSPWKTFQISALESPNITGEMRVPGLTELDFVEDMKREYGENSAQYKIRVLGKFASLEEGLLFSDSRIDEAEARWRQGGDSNVSQDRLVIGLDPAGESGRGDESVFVLRRGMRVLAILALQGLSAEAHVDRVEALIVQYRVDDDELPGVVIDATGRYGADIRNEMFSRLRRNKLYKLVPVQVSDKPRLDADAMNFDRIRDLLGQKLHEALRDGLAFPADPMLREELQLFELREGPNGKSKLTPKEDIRKALGRSPDRADALMLSVYAFWTASQARRPSAPVAPRLAAPAPRRPGAGFGGPGFDPYARGRGYNSGR